MSAMLKSNPRNADQYLHIRAWYAGNSEVYIRAKQLQAVVDDAPIDAVFYHAMSRRWIRIEDLSVEQRDKVRARISATKEVMPHAAPQE